MATINFQNSVGQSVAFDPTADLLSIGYPAKDVTLAQDGSNVVVTVAGVGSVTLLDTVLGEMVGEDQTDDANIAATSGNILVGDGENTDGDSGSDTINDSTGADLIYGLGGGDNIDADGGGGDIIFGGSGITDTTDGSDNISISGGSFVVYANAGNDNIDFDGVALEEDAVVSVFGGLGNDDVSADGGDESATLFVDLGTGDDTFNDQNTALEGAVTLIGGGGEDTLDLSHATGSVVIWGGAGETDATDEDDAITTGKASSTVYANAGDDTVTVTTITEDDAELFINGGIGEDTITAADFTTGTEATATILGGWDDDTISVTSDTADNAVTIYGGNGSTDTVDGADTITIEATAETNFTVYGNAGDDEITVTNLNGDSSIYGGLGDDEITVTDVTDGDLHLWGNTGSNTYDITANTSTDDSVTIHDFTSDDSVTLEFDGNEAPADLTVTATGSRIIIEDNGGFQFILNNYTGNLDGDNFNLTSTALGELLVNQGAATTLTGGTDADLIIAGDNGDRLVGGGGGNDVITGGDGNDTISFADADFGNGDVVDGGAGADVLELNTDATVNIAANEWDDFSNVETITFDADDVTTASTIAVAAGATDFELIDGSNLDSGTVLTVQDGGANMTSDLTINGGAGDDVVNFTASSGDYSVNGGDGDDNITLAGGDDVALGGDGDDEFALGAGDDTILGGDGDDTVYGSAGNDEITSGNGDDVFSYDAAGEIGAANYDTILDFESGDDSFSFDEDAVVGVQIGNGDTTVVAVNADVDEDDGTAVVIGTTDVLFIENAASNFDFDDLSDVASFLNAEDDIALNDNGGGGESLVIMITNGTNTGVYIYTEDTSDDDDFLAAELSMVALVTGVADSGDVTLF